MLAKVRHAEQFPWGKCEVVSLLRSACRGLHCSRGCDQMCDCRTSLRVKLVRGVFDYTIRIGDAFVLPQVFKPRFHQEGFDHSPRLSSIFEYSPCEGPISPPLQTNVC